MKRKQLFLLLPLLLMGILFEGCGNGFLSVQKESVNQSSLASTFVGSPDPLQKKPPIGEELVIKWYISASVLREQPRLFLYLFYRDYSQETVVFPINRKSGIRIFSLLNEKFQEKGGFFSYKAEILSQKGEIMKEWRHLLWVQFIPVDEEEPCQKDGIKDKGHL